MSDQGRYAIDELTAEQIMTLKHVYMHKGSKEIARIMGVSPHTVDQRMRRALKKLKVSSRVEAARILASYGIFDNVTPYQSLRYQPDNLADSHGNADGEQDKAFGSNLASPMGDVGLKEDQTMLPEQRNQRGHFHGPKLWMMMALLVVSTSIAAFVIIYFLLIRVGHHLS